jgi:hypothetical protein
MFLPDPVSHAERKELLMEFPVDVCTTAFKPHIL